MTAAFTFHTGNGTPLAGTLFEPAVQRGAATHPVLIASALGVPQRFYAAFAGWLAQRGHRVMTFDLSGMAASRQAQHRHSLKGMKADMLSWARQDFAAAVAHLAGSSADGRVKLIGHSLGLHHAAMTNAVTQGCIAHAVGVAAGAGYWRDWASASRRKAPLLMHVAGPLLTPLLGWFPGKRLGMVADLLAGVMLQWSRWCRHPQFAWGAQPELVLPSLQAARFTVSAFAFSDDEAMTEACSRKLLAALPNAPSSLRVLRPADVGLAAIGHLGAFKPGAAALWPTFESALGDAVM